MKNDQEKVKEVINPAGVPSAGFTITVNQLNVSIPAFQRLMAEKPIGNQALAVNMLRIWRSIKQEDEVITERRIEIVKNYGAEKDGDNYKIKPQDLTPEVTEALQKDLAELGKVSVTLLGSAISLEDLLLARVDVSPQDLDALDWLIS